MIADIIIMALAVFLVGLGIYKLVKPGDCCKSSCNGKCSGCNMACSRQKK